ncbi:MAG: toll/interleukin-1 receptor domain-containing protein [Candidatus Competibacteraceae bacterium]
MAFVPGYDNDIFVSYAHVDNEPLPGAGEGWVSTLMSGLKTRLAQLLGRSEAFVVWRDPKLSAHESLTPQLLSALKQSAALLIILSPGYLKSEWCLREKNTFLQLTRQRVRAGSRVFVVERHRFQPDDKPEELRELLGYRFWVMEPESNRLRILGEPEPNPHDLRYYDTLNDLASDLAEELKRLQQAAEQQKVSPPIAEQISADKRPAIFLAEVTDDLLGQRDEVQRYLDQAGFRVLPAMAFGSADALQQSLERDLPQCKLFVQLLSPLSGRHHYPQRQYEGARGTKIPILQWCDPALKFDTITDLDQLALLQGATVLAVYLEEFKREVVKRASAKPAIPIQPSIGPLVLLNASDEDDSLGQTVAEVIDKHGVGYVMPLRTGEPAEIREDLEQRLLESDGVIIVYGAVTHKWARNQVLHCHKFMSLRQRPLKALAVYEGPPEDKEDLRVKLPGMRILNCRKCLDENLLREFLIPLIAGTAA